MKANIGSSLALLVLVLAPGALHAQQGAPAGRPGGPGQGPPTAIAGQVQDAESGANLSAASVAVYSARDSALVTGALTDDAGRFTVPGVMPGGYYARVDYLGYETQHIDSIVITPAAPRADLGVVRMVVSAVQIEGLTVETERAAVQLAVDRTIYNARQLPAAAGGNATDVLRNVPAVEVDIDNNVSLRGNSNVAIQINGRPAPMRGEALKNFLQQLPAAMVDRVEVIPNPSARHDPEGMGGIINIVLQENTDLGLSAGINAGAGTGGRYNASGNVGWQSGPLTLTGSYGFMGDQREQEGFSFRTNLYPDTPQPITFFDQDIGGEQSMGGHNANVAGEWKFDQRHSINGSLGGNAFGFNNDGVNAYAQYDCPTDSSDPCAESERVLTSQWDVLNASEFSNTSLDAVLGYRRTVEPQRNEIIAELRYNFSRDETPNELAMIPGTGSTFVNRLQDVDAQQDQNEYIATLDFIRPLTPTLKIETGYKGTMRGLDSDYRSDIFRGDPLVAEPDSTTTNDFVYDEVVHAVYAVLSQDFGRFDAQAGLRAERTDTDFELLTGAAADTYGNGYTSLFPSASLLYELSEGGMQSLRASYSRRIRRPNARFLNPFPMVEDQFSEFSGNPELGPEYTDAFELTWQRSAQWGTLQLTPFYRRQTDIIRRYVDTSEEVRRTTFRNAASSDQYGADATSSLRRGPFNGFVSMSAYQQSTDASNVEAGLGSETFTWNARLSLGYKITESTSLQYFHFYRGAQELEQGRISAFEFSNVAIRQDLFEGASLTLRVMDPFDRMGFSFHTEDERQIQDTERSWSARAAFLQFSYTWGQQPRIRQGRPQEGQGQQPDADVGIQ